MKILLFIILVLIAYGSLYPFDFNPDLLSSSDFFSLFRINPFDTSRGDILANIVLFIPFGIFAMLAQATPALFFRQRVARLTFIVSWGLLFAFVLQLLQLGLPGRNAAIHDLAWNGLGIGLGILLIELPLFQHFFKQPHDRVSLDIPILMACAWIGYRLFPFIPSIDLQLMINTLKPLFQNPSLEFTWLIQNVTGWLLTFHFLSIGNKRYAKIHFFLLLLLSVFVLQLFIVNNVLHINEVVGGFLAITFWPLLSRRNHSTLLAILGFITILSMDFYPFVWNNEAANFHWIPFSGALNGNLEINIMATLNKGFLYASLIWLLAEAGTRLAIATIFVAAFLFFCELSQVYIGGHTPEITDPLQALLIGWVFFIFRKDKSKIERDTGDKQIKSQPPG